MISVMSLNGSCFSQIIKELNRKKNAFSFVNMTTSIIFEVIVFLRYLLVSNDGL